MDQQILPIEQLQTGSDPPIYLQSQQQQPQLHASDTSSDSFATSVSGASVSDLAQSIVLKNAVTTPSESTGANPPNTNESGNYVPPKSADFTPSIQDQHADPMDFTLETMTLPGNEDMLPEMEAIRNPTWWRAMMMPGSVNHFLHVILIRFTFARCVGSHGLGLWKGRSKIMPMRKNLLW